MKREINLRFNLPPENELSIDKFCLFDGASLRLKKLDLDSFITIEYTIKTPDEITDAQCMCTLPNKSIFCYGAIISYATLTGTTFIVDENHSVQELPLRISNIASGAIYYNSCVYVFGGFDEFDRISTARKFNLLQNKGVMLPNMPYPGCYCMCTDFMDKIIIASGDFEKVLIFDLFSYSYSEIDLNLKLGISKIVSKFNNKAYIIDISGSIYESEPLDCYKGNFVNSFQRIDGQIYGYKVFYNDCLYSAQKGQLIKFDFKKKKLKQFHGLG